MNISKAKVSSQRQITIPAEVCQKMELTPAMEVLFLEFRPGQFEVVAVPKNNTKKHWENWAKSLAGKYRNDSIDGVQSLLDDRKEDLILEERGYLNN